MGDNVSKTKIHILAKTKSHKNSIEKINPTIYKISTTEAPEKNKANKSIIKILSSYLHIAPSQIKISSGLTSRRKTVEITQ